MTGKPHHPTSFIGLAQLAARRLTGRDWFYMGLYGKPGFFKTSTALLFSKEVQKITLPEVPFDPLRQVVLSKSEYQEARRVLPEGAMILRDEGIKSGGNRMRFMSGDNNDVVEDVNTGRKRGHGVLECTPFADDVDKRLQKHMHWTARFYDKGRAKMHEVRLVGFKKVEPWEEPRFDLEIGHCAELDRPLWEKYLQRIKPDLDGQEWAPLAQEGRLSRYRSIAAGILRGGPPPPLI